jgi:hypothetical protein
MTFNGYVEDYGMEPANTTNQAIVGLVIGAVVSASRGTWRLASPAKTDCSATVEDACEAPQ